MAKILVVDDRPLNRQFLITLLGYGDHTLLEAADGAEALQLSKVDFPDLIICDILMPTMDGYEFVTRLHADPAIAAIPVIFYTATHLYPEARSTARSCGVTHVLTKPADPQLMLQTVDTALGVPQPTLHPRIAAAGDLPYHLLADKLPAKVCETETTTQQLAVLIELSEELALTRDPHRLLRKFTKAMRDIIGASYVCVGILENGGPALHHFVSDGLSPEIVYRLGVPAAGMGILGKLAAGRSPLRLRDLAGDPQAVGFPAYHPPLHSFLGVPVLTPTHVYGWVYLADKIGRDEFSLENERLAVALAAQAAIAYENIQLFSEAQHRTVELEQEIAERKRAEESLTILSSALEQTADQVVITDKDGVIEYVNTAFETLTGYSKEEAIGRTPRILKSGKHDQAFYRGIWQTITSGQVFRTTFTNRKKTGEIYQEEQTITPIRDLQGNIRHFVSTGKDITEHKQLEEQFRQSQKMEAIGQLTGGIAHDFNNLLTVILAFSEILLRKSDPAGKDHKQLMEIRKAGERAAALVDQLLAFSRKKVMQPRVLDLNTVIADVEKMLKRVIGEDIDLVTVLAPGLDRVLADAGQIDQIIMNLAVNTRDAMPRGGKLTIETANVELDEAYTRRHADVAPGRYVMLAVSDTGCGMGTETLSHIFEPFFTTKEQGRGTGLGLATVFGIVKQSGGHVWVCSEPRLGTTFRIYLPWVDQEVEAPPVTTPGAGQMQGTETVLVVEDEPALRELVRELLEEAGYTVLMPLDSEEALRLCEQHSDQIKLLLTDVVMPRMSGRELAERLVPLALGMRVLYTSGYADNAIIHHGVLSSDMAFLPKPFTEDCLLRKVREVLDRPAVEDNGN